MQPDDTEDSHSIPTPPPRPNRGIARPILLLFAVIPAVVVIALVTAAFMGIAAARSERDLEGWIAEFSVTPRGFFAIVLPAQIFLLATAVIAAAKAPGPLRARLGLVRPSIRLTSLPLLMVGTLALQVVVGGLMESFIDEPSEHLEELTRIVTCPQGIFGVFVVLSVSLIPGFCEELFFRGWALHRLRGSLPAPGLVFLTALVFAVMHLDLVHAAGVFLFGLWMGVITLKTNSVLPAILCHAFSNGMLVLFARQAVSTSGGDGVASEAPPTFVIVGAAAVFVVSALRLNSASKIAAASPEVGFSPRPRWPDEDHR